MNGIGFSLPQKSTNKPQSKFGATPKEGVTLILPDIEGPIDTFMSKLSKQERQKEFPDLDKFLNHKLPPMDTMEISKSMFDDGSITQSTHSALMVNAMERMRKTMGKIANPNPTELPSEAAAIHELGKMGVITPGQEAIQYLNIIQAGKSGQPLSSSKTLKLHKQANDKTADPIEQVTQEQLEKGYLAIRKLRPELPVQAALAPKGSNYEVYSNGKLITNIPVRDLLSSAGVTPGSLTTSSASLPRPVSPPTKSSPFLRPSSPVKSSTPVIEPERTTEGDVTRLNAQLAQASRGKAGDKIRRDIREAKKLLEYDAGDYATKPGTALKKIEELAKKGIFDSEQADRHRAQYEGRLEADRTARANKSTSREESPSARSDSQTSTATKPSVKPSTPSSPNDGFIPVTRRRGQRRGRNRVYISPAEIDSIKKVDPALGDKVLGKITEDARIKHQLYDRATMAEYREKGNEEFANSLLNKPQVVTRTVVQQIPVPVYPIFVAPRPESSLPMSSRNTIIPEEQRVITLPSEPSTPVLSPSPVSRQANRSPERAFVPSPKISYASIASGSRLSQGPKSASVPSSPRLGRNVRELNNDRLNAGLEFSLRGRRGSGAKTPPTTTN